MVNKEIAAHLNSLLSFQEYLLEQSHTFWHCAAQDQDYKIPFYYYQRNRIVSMSTCGVCGKLIENRKQIRALQKKLGIPQSPLNTNVGNLDGLKKLTLTWHTLK